MCQILKHKYVIREPISTLIHVLCMNLGLLYDCYKCNNFITTKIQISL